MIFGKTDIEREQQKRADEEYYTQWHPYFTWKPRRIADGRKAWLCWIERQCYWWGCHKNPNYYARFRAREKTK